MTVWIDGRTDGLIDERLLGCTSSFFFSFPLFDLLRVGRRKDRSVVASSKHLTWDQGIEVPTKYENIKTRIFPPCHIDLVICYSTMIVIPMKDMEWGHGSDRSSLLSSPPPTTFETVHSMAKSDLPGCGRTQDMQKDCQLLLELSMHRPGIEPGAGRHRRSDRSWMATANFTTKPPMLDEKILDN